MAKEIIIREFFNNIFGSIRVIEEDNKSWFVGKDIAKALGYKRERDALQDHVFSEYKLTRQIAASMEDPRKKSFTLINEPGVYQLIFRSKLKSAVKFQKWVFKEVLLAIRKDGMYEDEVWTMIRREGIYERNLLTSAIKLFENYCRLVHYNIDEIKYKYDRAAALRGEETNLYSIITVMINSKLNLQAINDRDKLDKKMLKLLDFTEGVISRIIIGDILEWKKPTSIMRHIRNLLKMLREDFIKKNLLEDILVIDLFEYIDKFDN